MTGQLRPSASARALARREVAEAVADGRLSYPDACDLCGGVQATMISRAIEAHHEDYSRPLDVLWLCKSCHARVHGTHGGLLRYVAWLRAQLAGAERLAERFAAQPTA